MACSEAAGETLAVNSSEHLVDSTEGYIIEEDVLNFPTKIVSRK